MKVRKEEEEEVAGGFWIARLARDRVGVRE